MGLFDKLKSLVSDDKKDSGTIEIVAPLSGEIVNIEDVPDVVFAEKIVGDGIAIKPTGNKMVAPVDGTIGKIFETNHAFSIESDSGIELFVHFGIDTVELKGEGFKRIAEEGQRVKVGDPVIEFDLPLLEEKTDRKFLDKALSDYRDARKGLDDLAKPSEKAIHPQYLAQQISHFADDDAIFTCDVGTPTVWAARYLKMNGKRRLLGSFNHGSMANAMPQALGAKATAPERQVVAMCGDGGFSMLMGDFLSVAQMKLPLKIVVFNNSVLGFVAMEMKAGGYLTDGTELHDTNFARIAEACGITGIRVEKASEVDDALQRAFAIDGPVLVDVVVAKEELAIPPQIKLEQAKGFSLYMLRAIISGRGDEVIELAKTNWLR